MSDKIISLPPIKEDASNYDIIEKKIKELFKKEIYYPVLYILNLKDKTLKNSKYTALIDAIRFDKIHFSQGTFTGSFNASISKELRALGATWDRKNKLYKIRKEDLPYDIWNVISTSKARYEERIGKIDKKLSELVPEEIASKLHIASQFDSNLWKVEKEFHKSIKNITVAPQLSEEQSKKIADEWQNNMRLWIKSFTEEHISELREKVKENAFQGYRRENLIKDIKSSYGVSERKAKFLARQETNLLMAKYKETKYVEAGVPEYRWGCVKMPHQSSAAAIYKPGEVRYSHGILEGKTFSWTDPPITTPPGEPQRRNNPGQDYNCRCFAIPIVRFK